MCERCIYFSEHGCDLFRLQTDIAFDGQRESPPCHIATVFWLMTVFTGDHQQYQSLLRLSDSLQVAIYRVKLSWHPCTMMELV